MLKKLLKALAVCGVLVLLYARKSPISEYSLPKIPWVIIFIATLTYGISLLFASKIPASRRLAIAYLVFTGLTYLTAGILGFVPNADLVESAMWGSLVSPYPLIGFFGQWFHRFPYPISKAPYETLPLSPHRWFSTSAILLSVIAIIMTLAMIKESNVAYRFWLMLLALSVAALLGYVIVGLATWNFGEIVLPLCWEASYVTALVLARRDSGLRKVGSEA